MNTFGGDSALRASGSIPRRLLLEEGRSNPGRLLSQDGSIPGASWEGTDRELGVPVPASSQAPPYVDTNLLIILAALVCALISAVSFFSMMRCALQCSRGAFRTPEAAATRRCNTAMKKAAINALPTLIYRKQMQPPEAEAATDCPICLAEFEDGEKLRALLQCNHCFHMECIDRWFRSHSSCPTCRNCVVAQAKPKAATPSNNSQAFQVCESSAIQIPRAECAVEVVDHVGRPARHGESFKDDRPGAGCWKSGKPLCDAACGIGR